MIKALVIFFVIVLTSFPSYSQNFNTFKNFTVDNPLSYQATRTMAQDRNGFIWFGSQEGVHRYDGHQFLSFHHDANNNNSLSSDVISRILIDSSEQIWVATRGGGLNVFRQQTKDFMRITSKSEQLSISNDNVNALIEDSNGNIWVGTEHGVNIIFRNDDTWQTRKITQQLGNPNSLANNIIETILPTLNGEVWVGTSGGGISVFNLRGDFIRSVTLFANNSAHSSDKLIKVLYQDKQANIWVGTSESGLIKLSATTGELTRFQFDEDDNNSLASNAVGTIYQDSSGRLWIGTDRGLMVAEQETNKFRRINHSVTNPHSLTNDFVLTIFEDKNQMIWIGTFSGVSRLDPHMTTFSQYNDQRYPKLASSLIMDFSQLNDEQLIFSTYANGIYTLTPSTKAISPIKFNISPNRLRVTTIFADNNILWVGSRASGLFKINLSSGNSTNYRFDSNNNSSISANSVTDIIKDKDGTLWVATYHRGLNRMNIDGSFTRFESSKPLSDKVPSTNHILQILEDHLGYLWLATYGGGLNRFNPNTESFIHINHDDQDSNSLSSDFSWIMLQDNDDNLWVGTQAAGINLLTRKNIHEEHYSFQHLDVKSGMKDQTVYGFTQDSTGNIWFSSNKGISRYSPRHQNFKNFDTRHGLIDLEYNHGAVFKGSDNTLYFGSAKGFTSVNPENILNDQPAPEVRLTNIFKLNEAMEFSQGLANIKSLSFDYSEQLISFEYVGLNYATPESTQYKYRLLGFDQQWIDAGKSRRATYTNLPAGNYTLQIIAGNSDNVWSSPGYSLDITVHSAPWNTWWAYLIYVIIIALTILSYTKMLNRKLVIEQQQKILLKKQVIDKTKDYTQKNSELEQANKQLEKAATVDKLTGVKSRRYLDIYIEQTSQLMNQIHQNILPVQRSILPRLYFLMIRIASIDTVNNSQLINLTDLLLYSRNPDDLVIRWSDDTFAIIGYEKDNNAGELAARLENRFDSIFAAHQAVSQCYCFYPFNREQPLDLSWDQVSVMAEMGLNIVSRDDTMAWLGLYKPKVQPFDYLQVVKQGNFNIVKQHIVCKQG